MYNKTFLLCLVLFLSLYAQYSVPDDYGVACQGQVFITDSTNNYLYVVDLLPKWKYSYQNDSKRTDIAITHTNLDTCGAYFQLTYWKVDTTIEGLTSNPLSTNPYVSSIIRNSKDTVYAGYPAIRNTFTTNDPLFNRAGYLDQIFVQVGNRALCFSYQLFDYTEYLTNGFVLDLYLEGGLYIYGNSLIKKSATASGNLTQNQRFYKIINLEKKQFIKSNSVDTYYLYSLNGGLVSVIKPNSSWYNNSVSGFHILTTKKK